MEGAENMDKQDRGLALISARKDFDEFCENLGYTNETLAQELGVGRATIFNWKKDSRGLPRIVSLALYALENEPRLRKMGTPREPKPPKQYRRNASE